ncbi:IS4 family transposase [Spirulina sp. CS-785/01]|uniref:IS4 family transposase n=1 Tax=Spirulina sp. CS-785/01 TaxID=3021716 RepID=UPI00232E797E|nr:IS4 family transposase [Spirulina sp. CS-785/01]MDB9311816.1 IS4 family transposase [Spirulina sp. CS-785/01]
MLPKLYHSYISPYLNEKQILTLEMLVGLLQNQKEVRIERLASHFPLPIKYESRRRHIQRFLKQVKLSVTSIWLPLIQGIIQSQFSEEQTVYIVLDRTQWAERNLFMAARVMGKRAIPIYWQFLEKKGASNLEEQKALLRPVLKVLKKYQVIVLGDREFHSVKLANWLIQKKVGFVLRQKKDTNVQWSGESKQQLQELGIKPGKQLFLSEIQVTHQEEGKDLSLALYWKRKYRGKGEKEPWYLLTNLPDVATAIKAYKKRVGIEEMFKDCKSGGYNLEGSKANIERLTRLVLLIAIAYTLSTFKGESIKRKGQQAYIGRQRKVKGKVSKNSNFWLGLYGQNWVGAWDRFKDCVVKLMALSPNKLLFYQRGLKAKTAIQQAL